MIDSKNLTSKILDAHMSGLAIESSIKTASNIFRKDGDLMNSVKGMTAFIQEALASQMNSLQKAGAIPATKTTSSFSEMKELLGDVLGYEFVAEVIKGATSLYFSILKKSIE